MRMSPARVWRARGSRYRLEASRCKDCGRTVYPPRPVCPYCRSRNVEIVELPRKGRVVTWTVQYTVPHGYRSKAPLILAIVELENGTRVFSELVDVEPEEIREGMEVEAVLRKVYEDGDEGVIVYATKFRPIKTG